MTSEEIGTGGRPSRRWRQPAWLEFAGATVVRDRARCISDGHHGRDLEPRRDAEGKVKLFKLEALLWRTFCGSTVGR